MSGGELRCNNRQQGRGHAELAVAGNDSGMLRRSEHRVNPRSEGINGGATQEVAKAMCLFGHAEPTLC